MTSSVSWHARAVGVDGPGVGDGVRITIPDGRGLGGSAPHVSSRIKGKFHLSTEQLSV